MHGGLRVLIVEDDDERRAEGRRALAGHGCDVREAATGAEALALLRESPAPVVVLLDYLLPEMCGYRLIEQVAAEPELVARHTFLVMSAHPALVQPPLPRLAGRWIRLVPKPVELGQLRAALARAAPPSGLGAPPGVTGWDAAEPRLVSLVSASRSSRR